MIEDTLDVDLKMFTDIIEDGKRPRSIREIKAKYELNYPFTVKRVVEAKALRVNDLYTIEGTDIQYMILEECDMVVGIPKLYTDKDEGIDYYANLDVEAWIFYS